MKSAKYFDGRPHYHRGTTYGLKHVFLTPEEASSEGIRNVSEDQSVAQEEDGRYYRVTTTGFFSLIVKGIDY